MSIILYRRETPNVAIEAKEAGQEFCQAPADIQAEFLHGWEQETDNWDRGIGTHTGASWPMQCRFIADELSPERKAAIALMLDTLLDYLKG